MLRGVIVMHCSHVMAHFCDGAVKVPFHLALSSGRDGVGAGFWALAMQEDAYSLSPSLCSSPLTAVQGKE